MTATDVHIKHRRRGTHHHRRRQRALVVALQFVLSLLRQPNDAAMRGNTRERCAQEERDVERGVWEVRGRSRGSHSSRATSSPSDLYARPSQQDRRVVASVPSKQAPHKKESTSLREQYTRAVRCSRCDSRAARSWALSKSCNCNHRHSASRSNWST